MNKIWGTTLYLGEKKLDTIYGGFNTKVYQNIINKWYILAMIYEKTNLKDENLELYTRIHSSCVTSEMLQSQDCDCVEQLNGALKKISEEGKGILFYLIQEGRGCGYVGKARACQMVQYSEFIELKNLKPFKLKYVNKEVEVNKKITTFDAYSNLGMKMDYREYDNIKEILQMLGIYEKAKFIVLTNNPDKINGLKNLNIKVLKNLNLEYDPNPFNHLYLKSKTVYGHDLNKTNSDVNNYDLPFDPILPFEPYNLENLKRFIHCASYYIPIRPYKNNYVIHNDTLKKLGKKIIKNNNLYKLTSEELKKYNINDPYWFKVNLFYDISTNLDYIVLEYENPYNKSNVTPLVRFHSESLFDRFPLVETLYKDRFKKSIYEIVKNGKGYLLLFYRDGRGSGLGYYLLNQKNDKNKIGINEDTRDYDAAVNLLKHFINNDSINMLYSDFSKYKVISNLIKNKVNVRNWVNIDDNDKYGVLSIKNRIFKLKNNILNTKVNSHLNLDINKKYVITGLGSSKSHAYYFKYLTKKYKNIDIEFIPIISDKYIDIENVTLILITQGLSSNTHSIIKKWNFKNIILITGNKSLNLDETNNKKIILNKLILNNCEIFNFIDDNKDDTLVRITGPTVCFYYIYKLLGINKNNLSICEKHLYQKLNDSMINKIIKNHNKIQFYIICNHPTIEFIDNIGNKLMETLFCKNPIIKTYMEFTHGTYQTSLINKENSIYLCLNSNLFENFKKLFDTSDNIILLNSFNTNDLEIIDYELIVSYWIDDIVNNLNVNHKSWLGKNKQKYLYDIDN